MDTLCDRALSQNLASTILPCSSSFALLPKKRRFALPNLSRAGASVGVLYQADAETVT